MHRSSVIALAGLAAALAGCAHGTAGGRRPAAPAPVTHLDQRAPVIGGMTTCARRRSPSPPPRRHVRWGLTTSTRSTICTAPTAGR